MHQHVNHSGPPLHQQEGTHPYSAWLETGWLLIALLIPLWVNLWGQQPFDYAKSLLLRTLIWLMVGIWVAGHIQNRTRNHWRTVTHLARNPILALAIALSASWLLSTWLATDWRTSLHGSYNRGQGLLTHISYLLLFAVVASELRHLEQAWRLATAIVLPTLPIALLGVAQWIGYDPLGFISDARSPLYTTLGRANFTGAYIALSLPITLALILKHSDRAERYGWTALFLLQGALIIATMARSAWLAAAVGAAVMLVAEFTRHLDARHRRRVFLVVGVAVLVAVATALASPFFAESGSLAARAAIWRATLELVAMRPLFGHGFDNMEGVFPSVYPPQLVYYQGRDVVVDRGHNLLLDTLMTTGGVGLLTATAFWTAAIRTAILRIRQDDAGVAAQAHLPIAAIAALAANTAGNLVSFDVTATATASWILAGLLMASALKPNRRSNPIPVARPPNHRRLQRIGALLLASCIVLPAIGAFNLRPLIADASHRTAVRHLTSDRLSPALLHAHIAVARWPIPEHHRLLGSVYLQPALSGELPTDQALAAAEAAYLAPIAARAANPTDWAALGDFYRIAGVKLEPALLPAAHLAYSQTLALAPHHATIHVAWAEVYLAQNDPTPALEHALRAVDLDATQAEGYRLIGDILRVYGGAEDEVLDAYYQALRWEPHSQLAYLGLAASYAQFGYPEAAAQVLAHAQDLGLEMSAATPAAWREHAADAVNRPTE